jgi:phosphate transport system permease protein
MDERVRTTSWLHNRRFVVDVATRYLVGAGGAGVIVAIALIFLYLFSVVLPLFEGADVVERSTFSLPSPDAGDSRMLLVEESGELAARITAQGEAVFFDLDSGATVKRERMTDQPLREASSVVERDDRVLLETVDGEALVAEISYPVTFAGGERRLIPTLSYPFESQPVSLQNELGSPVVDFVAGMGAFDVVFVAMLEGGRVAIASYPADEGLPLEFPDAVAYLDETYDVSAKLLLGAHSNWLYVATEDGSVSAYDIEIRGFPERVAESRLVPPDRRLGAVELLLGGQSVLAADDHGALGQWFLSRGPGGQRRFVNPRTFTSDAPFIHIVPEHRRKGIVAIDAAKRLYLLHTTSNQVLYRGPLEGIDASDAAISPRAQALLLAEGDAMHVFNVTNEHPEVSWSSLWGRVWYEGYPEPIFSWQSSSGDDDFEPKFSLVPLAFGTIKAAFYAMLFAMPLGVMGAIYTAYFMSAHMRAWVKPGIEIMAALPTVILGFIAGLWLAPQVEHHLVGIMALLVILPPGIILAAWTWSRLPRALVNRMPDGWQPVTLLPVLVVLVWLALALGPALEAQFFDGNAREWLQASLGLDYDQRNSLVVGIAMGLAVIPIIFSMSEDAIYSVPRHIVDGSLALGATPWQTLARVVLITASPGIFSAVMIGFGRAVGETMIVLMATGNTPIMDLNVFQGMRTFAANIAVELPEAEVSSSHYRILFLSALVLFVITFFFNTAAEVVRQRLRERYANL